MNFWPIFYWKIEIKDVLKSAIIFVIVKTWSFDVFQGYQDVISVEMKEMFVYMHRLEREDNKNSQFHDLAW
jgi:hypothetical protein